MKRFLRYFIPLLLAVFSAHAEEPTFAGTDLNFPYNLPPLDLQNYDDNGYVTDRYPTPPSGPYREVEVVDLYPELPSGKYSPSEYFLRTNQGAMNEGETWKTFDNGGLTDIADWDLPILYNSGWYPGAGKELEEYIWSYIVGWNFQTPYGDTDKFWHWHDVDLNPLRGGVPGLTSEYDIRGNIDLLKEGETCKYFSDAGVTDIAAWDDPVWYATSGGPYADGSWYPGPNQSLKAYVWSYVVGWNFEAPFGDTEYFWRWHDQTISSFPFEGEIKGGAEGTGLEPTHYGTIWQSGDPRNRVNLVLHQRDGFSSTEDRFTQRLEVALNNLHDTSFGKFMNYLNIYYVYSPYPTTMSYSRRIARKVFPFSTHFGGIGGALGNAYLGGTTMQSGPNVIAHEFGHMFGALDHHYGISLQSSPGQTIHLHSEHFSNNTFYPNAGNIKWRHFYKTFYEVGVPLFVPYLKPYPGFLEGCVMSAAGSDHSVSGTPLCVHGEGEIEESEGYCKVCGELLALRLFDFVDPFKVKDETVFTYVDIADDDIITLDPFLENELISEKGPNSDLFGYTLNWYLNGKKLAPETRSISVDGQSLKPGENILNFIGTYNNKQDIPLKEGRKQWALEWRLLKNTRDDKAFARETLISDQFASGKETFMIDVNADGISELGIAGNRLGTTDQTAQQGIWIYQLGRDGYQLMPGFNASLQGSGLGMGYTICDIDGNGFPDIIRLNNTDAYGNRDIELFFNNGKEFEKKEISTDEEANLQIYQQFEKSSLIVHDFTGDYLPDILKLSNFSSILDRDIFVRVKILENNGDQSFTDISTASGIGGFWNKGLQEGESVGALYGIPLSLGLNNHSGIFLIRKKVSVATMPSCTAPYPQYRWLEAQYDTLLLTRNGRGEYECLVGEFGDDHLLTNFPAYITQYGDIAHSLEVIDLDGDSLDDVLMVPKGPTSGPRFQTKIYAFRQISEQTRSKFIPYEISNQLAYALAKERTVNAGRIVALDSDLDGTTEILFFARYGAGKVLRSWNQQYFLATQHPLFNNTRNYVYGDLDNDGDPDFFSENYLYADYSPIADAEYSKKFLTLEVRNRKGSFAVGARAILMDAQGKYLKAKTVMAGKDDKKIFFGVKPEWQGVKIKVQFPGGREVTFDNPPLNSTLVVGEPQ